MIKWREWMSRDLLFRRKFDWQFAGKIAKYEENFGECAILPLLPLLTSHFTDIF